MVGVVLGLLFFVIVLLVSNANQHTFDLTANKQFSLSDQSIKAVQNLKGPVKVWAFIDEKTPPGVEELLKRYQHESSNFTYEMVYPTRKPTIAIRYDIHQPGVAVVELVGSVDSRATASPTPKAGATPDADAEDAPKTRRERTSSLSEEEITNAILKLGRNDAVKVYTLTGHGEHAIDGTEGSGLSNFQMALGKEGFTLLPLSLATQKDMPTDSKILVIAGPKTPLLPKEEQQIQAFLKNNGRLFLMLEHDTPADYLKLMAEYGIESPDQIILDPLATRAKEQPVTAVGVIYDPKSPITKGFRQYNLFEFCRPVVASATPPAGAQVSTLVSTNTAYALPSKDVIGVTDIALDTKKYPPSSQSIAVSGSYPHPDPNATPTPTPLPGAAAPAGPKAPETRIVVFGDSDWLTNNWFTRAGARDLSLNIINWLAESENQISIRSTDPAATPIRLTESEMRNQVLFHVFIAPLAVAIMGVALAWRRR